MPFVRSYSKVWWGSDNQLPSLASGSSFTGGGFYLNSYEQQQATAGAHNSHYHLHQQPQQASEQQQQQHQYQHHHHHQPFSGSGYHSLDYNSLKMFSGNLSRIQEVDDEQANMSKLSWEKHDSPGSLRSQDSGFSDNDESHSTTRSLRGRTSKNSSPSAKSDISRRSANSTQSPSTSSTHTIATPPTVIRRVGRSEFYSPLVNVSRRISFSGSPALKSTIATAVERNDAKTKNADDEQHDVADDDAEGELSLLQQLDSFNLLNSTPKQNAAAIDIDEEFVNVDDGGNVADAISANDMESSVSKAKCKPKRRRRILRTPTKPLPLPLKRRTLANDSSDENDSDNNNDDNDDDDNKNDSDESKARKCCSKSNEAEIKTDNAASSCDDEPETEIAELRQNKRTVPAYYNETIYLGAEGFSSAPYNNETVILGSVPTAEEANSLKRTSTPKAEKKKAQQPQPQITHKLPKVASYSNPLLNGHGPALQHWLYELRGSYDQEVMSTLQTKSIAQEAFKNLTITTNTVAKLIRQLQQRALYMQNDFERIERVLLDKRQRTATTLHEALSGAEQLVANIVAFTGILERRAVFFSDSRTERKRYEDNLDQIKMIAKDTRYSLERQHYINLESLLDDVQVLKRYLLIALRLVFERMVRIIVQSIEYGRCDLMLRANINMIATLSNIDYEGFASLTDAFVQNEAVRALLIVCLEHKLSSVRALALRALATICCAPAAIAQLSACDGIEILRDVLQGSGASYDASGVAVKRGAVERREAVSLLTQLTAAWHGPEHRVEGLTNCVESIVASLSQLVVDDASCSQTLLLCAATLNNLSRMEVTSHYSIMSNETIFKLIETIEARRRQYVEESSLDDSGGISIFLYEQIVSMLHNMSLNKKCHSHLANGCIINFITSAYEMEFYKRYNSRAERDAQQRTIKAILHTLTRLVHDTNNFGGGGGVGGFGLEHLQQQLQEQGIPAILCKLSSTSSHHYGVGSVGSGGHNASGSIGEQNVSCHQLGRDIELLVRQLETAQKQAQQQAQHQRADSFTSNETKSRNDGDDCEIGDKFESSKVKPTIGTVSSTNFKLNLTKQESFV